MAVYGALALIWRIKLCEILMLASAPVGAMFTAITLVTGMLWGKPTWGTYWEWDARMTSELVLLFLYFGVLGLAYAYDDLRQGARAAAVLALVGVVNVPIIHFSVQWWNTLHQGESVQIIGKSTIHGSMLWPLLIMAVATKLYFLFALLQRARVLLLEQERGKAWVRDLAMGAR
jgi:heme exporter protein C